MTKYGAPFTRAREGEPASFKFDQVNRYVFQYDR